ncbi:hypothetical protein F5I97DRAFT_1932757 [Phlebopus sp. FC_14]|nr:hypothetical protein F5I97DRAFT_1932757 [Phlebopus sp. FC_14]
MIIVPPLKKARTKENMAVGSSQPKYKLSSKGRYIMDFVAVPPPSWKFTRQPSTPLIPAVLTFTLFNHSSEGLHKEVENLYSKVALLKIMVESLNHRSNSTHVKTQKVGLQVKDIEMKVEDVSPSHELGLIGYEGSGETATSRLLPLPLSILPLHEPRLSAHLTIMPFINRLLSPFYTLTAMLPLITLSSPFIDCLLSSFYTLLSPPMTMTSSLGVEEMDIGLE